MIDARAQVAAEFAERVFERLFVRPRGWDDAQADEHIQACVDAIRPVLPRDRADGLDLCRRAGQRLKAESRTNAWPTVREVCDAIRNERESEPAGADGWPHRNSEAIIAAAERWVENFRDWPRWLGHEDEVAEALLSRGACSWEDLAAAGYRVAVDRRVKADRARIEAVSEQVASRFPSNREDRA